MNTQWPDDTYVLIPSYKSIGQLRPFIDSLIETVPKAHICVVDDGSKDGTYEYCIDTEIDCVRHHRNRGKGAALRTGFSHLISTKGVRNGGIDTDSVTIKDIAGQARNDSGSIDTDSVTIKDIAGQALNDSGSINTDSVSINGIAGQARNDSGSINKDSVTIKDIAGQALNDGGSIDTDSVSIDGVERQKRALDKYVAGQARNAGGSIVNTNGSGINASTSKKCKWILTMDADGQHSPADIPRFIAESKRRPAPGICVGARDMRLRSMPPARVLSNRLTSLILTALTGRRVLDSQCGYRLYSADFLKSIQIEHNRFEAESELIQKAAAKHFPIRFTGVRTLYLRGGSSHISHLPDTLRWVAAVVRVWFQLTFTDGKRGL